MEYKCPKCGYKERGLSITKKMIREVGVTRTNNWYALRCIYEKSYYVKNKQGEYYRKFTPNQIDFIKACIIHNDKGLITNKWVNNIKFDKTEELK